jgi:GT2 family glycosyltransferase
VTTAPPDALALVVVTHESAEQIPRLWTTVSAQLREGDEFVIVDNASTDATAELARSLGDAVAVIETGSNLGFAGGCHVGAEGTSAPLLLFLNPDTELEPGCLDALRAAARRHPEWATWQAAVLLDERLINSAGGVVHFLGIAWAGGCGQPLAALGSDDRAVAFPSGAAMVIRRAAWEELGGFDRKYFMYGEDLDLGLRVWLAGDGVGLVPSARVRHSYEFDKGTAKWFLLERNRWRTVLSVYPARLLLLLFPALLAAELGLIAIALAQGWLAAKLRAQAAVIAGLPGTLARRRRVQCLRRIGADEFAGHLTCSLDSPYLQPADKPWLRRPQALYWRLARFAVGARGG